MTLKNPPEPGHPAIAGNPCSEIALPQRGKSVSFHRPPSGLEDVMVIVIPPGGYAFDP